MGWISYSNRKKNNSKTDKSWINSRLVWFIGQGEKDIAISVRSKPSFGWGITICGSEGDVSFRFWLLLSFYVNFSRVFPEWVYAKEYNQFADKEASSAREKKDAQEREIGFLENKPSGYAKEYYDIKKKNEKLKGRKRTKEKGWIRTGRRELSLSFHHYSMWWNIWRDDDSWSSDTPWYISGSIDFVRLLKGKDKVDKELESTIFDEIQMPEGKYMCKINHNKYTKRFSRWWPEKWNRFEFEFGYNDADGNWVTTPVPHWGKGENSYDCGMDGTYSTSLGSGVKNIVEAKEKVVNSCMRDRERYGDVDFSNVSGIENGYVMANLIGQL